jgi:peptidoglycan hydrolase-like protein with peptidoglycan-binding domain
LTESLIAAVKNWQRAVGLPPTGVISVGDVVVQPGPVRVDSVAVQPGVRADAGLMSVTPTDKVVTVLAEVAEASGVESGNRVTVTLPGGTSAPGRVAAVGTEVKAQQGESNAAPRMTITVTLDDPAAAARIDSADVQVALPGEVHKDVLVAPIGALLALSEGGYAVQVQGGGLVAVKTGLFAKGLVEISGNGLAAGTRVVTTS